jgi:hypothetical protein
MNRNDPFIGQAVSRYRIREKPGEGGTFNNENIP